MYKDIRGNSQFVDSTAIFGYPGSGKELVADAPAASIFFSSVDPGGPNQSTVNIVLDALGIPLVPVPPQISNAQFNGASTGHTTYEGSGGTFTFQSTDTTSYQIVISRDGSDYDPAEVQNATLTGVATNGTNTVPWDGLDNAGNVFPVGSFEFKIVGRNGEIHFPMIDVEGSKDGGPTLSRLNGHNLPDHTVFYDDRGYVTRNGVAVGELNGKLCGASNTQPEPTPTHSLLGVDSSAQDGSGKYYRHWSIAGNKSVDCDPNFGFGDAKALDLWTFQQTPVETNPVEIILQPNDAEVSTAVNVPPMANPGATVHGTFNFKNSGTTDATGVGYTAIIGTPGNCPTNLNFPVIPVGVTFTYDNLSCVVTLSGMPTTLTGAQTLNFGFSYTAPPSGSVPVDTTITTGNANNAQAHGETLINLPANITLEKTGPASAIAGGNLSYVISLGNNGGIASGTTLTVADTLSSGVSYISVVPGTNVASVSCTGAPSLVCTVNLSAAHAAGAANGTASFTINTTAPSTAGSIINYASVDPAGGNTPPTPGASCIPATSCDDATTTVVVPEVSVAKISDPANGDTVAAGDVLTYTVTATVSNAALTSALVLTDTLGARQTFTSVTNAGSYTADTSGAPTLTFTLPSGTVPGTYAVIYTTTVDAGASGTVGNSVAITGNGGDPDPTCTTCSTEHPRVSIPVTSISVPVDSRWFLILLSTLLLAAGLRRRKRQQH